MTFEESELGDLAFKTLCCVNLSTPNLSMEGRHSSLLSRKSSFVLLVRTLVDSYSEYQLLGFLNIF